MVIMISLLLNLAGKNILCTCCGVDANAAAHKYNLHQIRVNKVQFLWVTYSVAIKFFKL